MIDWEAYDKETDDEGARIFEDVMKYNGINFDINMEASSQYELYVIRREIDKDILKRMIEIAESYPKSRKWMLNKHNKRRK